MESRKITSLDTLAKLTGHLRTLGVELPLDEELIPGPAGPLAQPIQLDKITIGNRFCILPMEGWDAEMDGKPSALTVRRWKRFGLSGAKLIWGGEAVAVQHDGRANPNQLLMAEENLSSIEQLRVELEQTHQQEFGRTDDLYVGLQLTHSGRFARPNDKQHMEPRTLYNHPLMDEKFGTNSSTPVMTDDEIERLIERFVSASSDAHKMGYRFVDIKHCHGYLGHEFLSSFDRPGRFGGSLENRTRFLRQVVEGIRGEAPDLQIGVRVSVYDTVPFRRGGSETGEPIPHGESPYRYAFGGDGTGTGSDLSEPSQFLSLLESLGISMVCTTIGSPYYVPHLQRPAWYPPSDGYQSPVDPLVGVAIQLAVTAELRRVHPRMMFVGSGYSYLQEWLGHIGQAAVSRNWVDSVGLGRMVLSYPDLPADIFAGRPYKKKLICRTFSDCTTGPRNGMVSGCFPLDDYYRQMPERDQLKAIKAQID